MLGGFHHGQTPAFFARRHQMNISPRQQRMLVIFRDLPVEKHLVHHPTCARIGMEFRFPPAGADDV
ncbi:putative uncharacterized protein [Corynebacterium casei UCMA 3821]|uniref:Uncharacterized protein n=1 Tax=Corynebacterium casei UCMA 3821 TaxID=1110505 RepID=G7HY11_9CORY|nr:putative uncharacterized protein [Corynebacterium casei UCMA 3821]